MILEGEEFAFPLRFVKTIVVHHRDTTSMKYIAIHLRKQYDETVQDCSWGGGGLLNKCLYGEAQPLTLLYTIFPEKSTPFVYLLLTNGTLSHTLFRTLHPF